MTTVAPESFATARLVAHRAGGDDEDFVVAMFADPRVTATLGGPRDRETVGQALRRWDEHWVTHGFGPWIVDETATGAPVGWILLHVTDTGGPGSVEVGWSIAADRWGAGLATEGGAAATRIGFRDVGVDALVSFTLPGNRASRGVMEKLGFAYDCDVEHAGLPHVLYRLTKKDWETHHG
ncbi:MAG: GNAT family N-acetyltransferase [Acidimicrobiia bacterium]